MIKEQADLEKLVSFLGLKSETFDEAKKEFENDFGRKTVLVKDEEFLNPIIGKRLGSVTTKAKKYAKEFGIELKAEDLKEKYTDEDGVEKEKEVIAEKVLDKIFSLTSGTYKSKITDLETQLEKAMKVEPDEKVKKLQSDYEETVNKLTLAEKMRLEKEKEFEGFKTTSAQKLKQRDIKRLRGDLEEKVKSKYKPGTTPLEIKGFKTEIEEKYNFDLEGDEENPKLIVLSKDGKPIKNDAKSGSFFEYEEILNKEGLEKGIIPKNPFVNQNQNNNQHQNNGKTELKIQYPENIPASRRVAPRGK